MGVVWLHWNDGTWGLDGVGFRYHTMLGSLSGCLSGHAILVLIRTYWICRPIVKNKGPGYDWFLVPGMCVLRLPSDWVSVGPGGLAAFQRAREIRESEQWCVRDWLGENSSPNDGGLP